MFERRLLKRIDYVLISSTIILILIGFLLIFSVTRITHSGETNYDFIIRQIIWFAFGIIFSLIIISTNYELFLPLAKYIYILNLILLILTLFYGEGIGAQRWLSLGIIQIQPSEFSKLAIIITLSSYLANIGKNILKFKYVLLSFIHIIIPVVLIFKQPNMGTSLTFFLIWLSLIFISGAKIKHIILIIIPLLLTLPILWSHLHIYQQKRLLAFIHPDVDPLDASYHAIQSKIAIGSGEFLGKGLFSGTQSQLHFIPNQHTDFIFSALGEEGGFVGCVIVLLLYLIIIWRGIKIAEKVENNFGKFLAVGIVSIFIFHILVNVGMTIGIMPITGIPLPFLSYGGSSLLTCIVAISFLLCIKMRSEKLRF